MKVIDSKILLTVTEKCDGECMIKFGNLVTPLEPKQWLLSALWSEGARRHSPQ